VTYDDFDDLGDCVEGFGPAFAWWDGDVCPKCQSAETIILRHGYLLDQGFTMRLLTDPFLGFLSREFRWERASVGDQPRRSRFVSVFAESKQRNLHGGRVWWNVQGYVEGLRSDQMEFICRDCGEPWVGMLRRPR
jgi:hypothetical protein